MDNRQQFIVSLHKERCVWRKKVYDYKANVHRLQTKGATETAIQNMRKEVLRTQGILETLEQEYRRIVQEQSEGFSDAVFIIIMVVIIIGLLLAINYVCS